jgi:uncharacterized Zn-finger protein
MAFGGPGPTPDIASADTVVVENRVVACDGDPGPLGHPRVWLRIADRHTDCPYCSRRFVLRDGAGDDHGH